MKKSTFDKLSIYAVIFIITTSLLYSLLNVLQNKNKIIIFLYCIFLIFFEYLFLRITNKK